MRATLIPRYDDWMMLYSEEFMDALSAGFERAAILVDPTMPIGEAHRLAVIWAREEAGELLKLDGSRSLAATTRDRVKMLVGDAIEQGQSLGQLKKLLRVDPVFDKTRASLVARTETAMAHGQGSRDAAANSGRDGKRWVTQGVSACDDCQGNADDGDIGIDDQFSSGDDTIPCHPNCECNVRYFHR